MSCGAWCLSVWLSGCLIVCLCLRVLWRIFQLPFAYCSVSQSGYCRYAEHLSISVGLQGDGLLRRHPELCACDRTPQWGWEACHAARPPGQHGFCITTIQTAAMREADPGFCKLARQCVEGAAAAHGD